MGFEEWMKRRQTRKGKTTKKADEPQPEEDEPDAQHEQTAASDDSSNPEADMTDAVPVHDRA